MAYRQQQNPRLAKAEVRKEQYAGLWATSLSGACFADPLCCCASIWCSWCASYQLRQRALRGDMSRYLCCNGDWPCSGRCGEQKCPEFCLCMEVFWCFPQSVASTRWMVQDEMRLQNTPCDNAIIGVTIAAQYLACLCWCAACITGSNELMELVRILDWIADFMWCSMCACMQTQHKVQLDARDARPGMVQPPHPMMAPPPQAMGFPPPGAYAAPTPQGPAPPPGAYPPPPGYPPPPQYYPPPPPTGYPPQR